MLTTDHALLINCAICHQCSYLNTETRFTDFKVNTLFYEVNVHELLVIVQYFC